MVLDERLAKELREIHDKFDVEGKLRSRTELEGYYDTFRKRFGPDKLKNLDGESLLMTIHGRPGNDSLVYWLEFKNDEEFPAIFGSIAGGSALKFGIYRRKETGAWMTGSPQRQRELSLAEATQYARNHLDQLLKGAELLDKFPAGGSEADYKALQQDMDTLVPDVSRLAWGHKYFSLLYPEKLDSYHNVDYQRFHLIKLGQMPPEGNGLYIAAGRYVAIAGELGIPMASLMAVLQSRNGSPYRYWRVAAGEQQPSRDGWEVMRDGNYIAIGWAKLADLSRALQGQNPRDAVFNTIKEHDPDATDIRKQAQDVLNFVSAMSEGDLVLAAGGKKVLGVGRVSGGYYYEPPSDSSFGASRDFPHRRPVEWLDLSEWNLPDPEEGIHRAVGGIKGAKNMVEIEKRIAGAVGAPSNASISSGRRERSFRLDGVPGRIQSILERKGQVILYGPPGTGKTYWAEITARELAARLNFEVGFEQLTPDQKPALRGDGRESGGMVRMCSFHPAYGYEDFLEGYRPEIVNDQMVFNLRDGIFKQLCQDAQARPDQRFYLIIDEINRGDIPRIFGELLTVLEKNKRGKTILLPLSGAPFQVPENVYIIGTMNTADRSIALLDTALRRRFGFIELMPDSSVLGNTVVRGIPLAPWLDSLNRQICEYVGRDARNLQIGHSYLLDGGRPIMDFARLARVIREDIIPLLEEYCYEDYSTLEQILGKGLVDRDRQQIRDELFEETRQDELVQALLRPELTTSRQALASEAEDPASTGEEEGDTEDKSEAPIEGQ